MKLHNAIIGGYPRSGKTVMLLHLASIVLSQGYTALYIGHENHPGWIKDLSGHLEFDLGGLKILHANNFNADPTLGKDLKFDYVFIDDTYLYGDQILQNLIAKCGARNAICIFSCQVDIKLWNSDQSARWRSICDKYPLEGFDKFTVDKYRDQMESCLMEDDKVIERLKLH